MSPKAISPPSDARLVARAREHFLESGEVGDFASVREPILTSWRRSQFWGVSVEFGELPHQDIDTDTRLVRAAQPVLDRLQLLLSDMAVSVILTDARANILDRRAGDPSLNQELDAVWLAPGFSYAEQFAGTNAIGVALEEKRSVQVLGSEHFCGRLQTLSCAGAPIVNPLSGRTEGVIDVTTWRSEANPLMPALVQQAATDIEQRLLDQASERERALLQQFLAANRRANQAVLTVNDDLIIANASAAQLLGSNDHALVRERAVELVGSEGEVTADVLLSGGRAAKLRCRSVMTSSGMAGAIVELSVRAGPTTSRRDRSTRPPAQMPDLAGRSHPWSKACDQVESHCRARNWLLITGEPGVGKCAIATAAHRRWFPTGHLAVIDAADGAGNGDGEGWLEKIRPHVVRATSTLILRHADQLSPEGRQSLATVLDALADIGPPTPWLVVTSTQADLEGLLGQLPVSVAVPPLRHHVEDIRDLVPAFLDRYAPGRSPVCTAEALQTLMRASWPGNIAQLERVIRLVLTTRRAGSIGPEDLPPECFATSRRVLTHWEMVERDAITQSLVELGGDKVEAAQQLGISRATIYRKIRAYGIDIERRP